MAAGDVDADGYADVITGTGPGVAAHVKAFSGANGSLLRSLLPYGTFTGGAYVAARAAGVTPPPDSDGDGIPDPADPDTVGALVAAFPDGAFRATGQRRALLSRLDFAEQQILADDVAGAISTLSAVLPRLDGCASSPAADRDDWIVDCDAQRTVRTAIEGVIGALQP